MNKSLCSHLRIVDKNDYDLNVPDFIKFIEEHFNMDFRSLPDWERLLVRLHAMTTDRNRTVQAAYERKEEIIERLLVEFSRPSPFELTATLSRTSRKWENIAMQVKERLRSKKAIKSAESKSEYLNVDVEKSFAIENETETPHQNTEIGMSGTPTRQDLTESPDPDRPLLPKYVTTNDHPLISPLLSNEPSINSYVSRNLERIESQISDWKRLAPTKIVACAPTEIILKYDNLEEQTIKFALTNLSRECIYVRYHTIKSTPHFKYTKIVPVAPPKLCPGIPMYIKFIFKLVERKVEFTSELFFKVGRNIYNEFAPTEILSIPIITKFIKSRNVQIPEAVYIPPSYPWHMKLTYPLYPKTFVKIEVKDDRFYHLHIEKKYIKDSVTSLNEWRNDKFLSDIEIQTFSEDKDKEESDEKGKPKKGKGKKKDKSETDEEGQERKPRQSLSIKKGRSSMLVKRPSNRGSSSRGKSSIEKDILSMIEKRKKKKVYDPVLLKEMTPLAEYIVNLALDAFLFENTYLFLKPNVKVMLPVYLTKIENMGSMNCYYDFKLMDPAHDELVITKLVRIFADVLPCPIQIEPPLMLYMDAQISFGYWKDHFTVHNRDIIHKVIIKLKLTNDMENLVTITPTETIIPNLSSVDIYIKFCSKDSLLIETNRMTEDSVHFNVKIQVIFGPHYYTHMRPIYYEIVAPCVSEFREAILNELSAKYDLNRKILKKINPILL